VSILIVKSKVNQKVKYDKVKIYLLLFCFFISLVGILVFNTDFFLIKEIIVLNNYTVPDKDIIGYSGINKEQNIFKLNISVTSEKIEKHPYIKSVNIERKLPSKIIIDIVERNKVAALYYMGIYIIIDDEGYILKTASQVKDEIVIEGFNIENFIEGSKIDILENKELETTLVLCELIRKDFKSINRIKYNNRIIEVYINDNYKVKFGIDGDIKSKYLNFIKIYNDLESKNIYNGIIDLSHNGYPIYRPFGE